ncbi:MAG: aldo/keto reductase [Pseudomonadota bacterium]|jgi:aryl-alcohol dehydrogenase-like predicted oxidoreductase|nr:MAG: aldo/keto reductase [Pseudomonadota bacterium]
MKGIGDKEFSRRQVIQAGVAASVAMTAGPALAAAASQGELITRPIPSSGERLPVVGTGTNAYGDSDRAELKRVLTEMPKLGGKVIDTAFGYRGSEVMIGGLLAEIGNRDQFFLATKTPMNGDISNPKAVLDGAFSRLQVDRIDLMQVHNLYGMDELMPHIKEYKAAGRFRYVGMSTSMDNQYEGIMAAMRRHRPDFVQVDYSIGNRGAADSVLPLAQELGCAVLINVPFGGRGRSFFPRVANVPVPEWAAQEFDARTWAQFFIKYIVSHPAVTATIPGTTTMAHLEDNQAGARGRLPNAAQRKKMEEFWDSLPG